MVKGNGSGIFMKICDVVLNSIWYDPRVRKQIAEYIRNGCDVSCVGMKCRRYDAQKVSKLPCKANIVAIKEKYDGKQRSVFRKLMREYLKNKAVTDAIIAQKPDLIHANDFNVLIPAYKAAKKLGCKIIYDSHEINVENIGSGGIYQKYMYFTERRLVRKVDLMVCVSHAASDYFANEYKIKNPTVITNCALEREICRSEEKNDGFEVLNHGQFYEGRGYDIMVEAIPLLRDYPQIKLAVRGMGRLEEALRGRAAELGGENFIFYPPVAVEELIPMASRSMVGVAITEAICLNFKLSVSNKIFEYAAAGLPVIMSDIPEHRYLNEKYHFGIILPENSAQEFAKAVLKLYQEPDFYRECSENAIRMSNELNWEKEFDRLISLEESLFSKA